MRKLILAVEDQEANMQILRDLLTSAGYEIVEAENGEQALAAVAKRRPDLILMDIQLPIMDGYEATRAIREWERATPDRRRHYIVALTANSLSGDREKCLDAGMDDYVSKPVRREDLLGALERGEAAVRG